MAVITYENRPRSILVRIDGRKSGAIYRSKGGGFHYARNSTTWGATFPTVAEVKRSIEGED